MIWKKTWISYFLWACFGMIVCITFSICTILTCTAWNLNDRYAIIGVVCLSFLLLAGLFFLLRWLVSLCFNHLKYNTTAATVLEAIAVVGSLAGGLVLRFQMLFRMDTITDIDYIARAFVEQGKVISDSHGAQFFYLHTMRILFLGVGNKPEAAFYFQILLQVLTGFIIWQLLRRTVGKLPGVLAFAGIMFLPQMIQKGMDVSYSNYYILLFFVGLTWIYGLFESRQNVVLTITAGIITAVLTYLDITGLALVAGSICIFWAAIDCKGGKRVVTWLTYVVSFAAAFFLCFAIQTWTTHTPFMEGILNYINDYRVLLSQVSYQNFSIQSGPVWGMIVYGILVFSLFGFWEKKGKECLSFWIILLTLLLYRNDYRIYLEWILIVLSLYLLYIPKNKPILKKETEEINPKGPGETEESEEAEEPVEILVEEPKVKLIDNPLPVPKKHVAKELDFDVIEEIEAEDDYDYPVKTDDDYDL